MGTVCELFKNNASTCIAWCQQITFFNGKTQRTWKLIAWQ